MTLRDDLILSNDIGHGLYSLESSIDYLSDQIYRGNRIAEPDFVHLQQLTARLRDLAEHAGKLTEEAA